MKRGEANSERPEKVSEAWPGFPLVFGLSGTLFLLQGASKEKWLFERTNIDTQVNLSK